MSENVQENMSDVPFAFGEESTSQIPDTTSESMQDNAVEKREEVVDNGVSESQPSNESKPEIHEIKVETPAVSSSAASNNNNSSSSYNKKNNSTSNEKGDEFRHTVAEYSVSMYRYAARIKKQGHSSVADLMFKDLMTIIMATNTASEAIGRDKFMQFLEEGYYASSRMMEYMKFLSYNGVVEEMYEPLMESNTRIHKVFGASLKTTRSKKQTVPTGM